MVPVTVKNAAQLLLNHGCNDAAVIDHLKGLIDAPSSLPTCDPDVIVSCDVSTKSGDVQRSFKVPLSEYIVVYTLNPTLYYTVGRWGEVSIDAREFSVEWANDVNSEHADTCWMTGAFDHREELVDALRSRVEQCLRLAGPFTSDKDFQECNIREHLDEGEEIWTELTHDSSYPVHVRLEKAVEVATRDWNTGVLPKTGFKTGITLCFASPHEAAAFIVTRPNVRVEMGFPGMAYGHQAVRDQCIDTSNLAYTTECFGKQTDCNIDHGDYTVEWKDSSLKDKLHDMLSGGVPFEGCMMMAKNLLKRPKN